MKLTNEEIRLTCIRTVMECGSNEDRKDVIKKADQLAQYVISGQTDKTVPGVTVKDDRTT